MADTTARVLMGTWEIQHYLTFKGTDGTFGTPLKVTEDTKADTKVDDSEYKPKYLDRKEMPKYVMGRSLSIEFEQDAMIPGEVQSVIFAHEDEVNIPCQYMRTINYDPATGTACPAAALIAKRAESTLTPDPISGDSGDPAKVTYTVNKSGEWEYGTYDPATKTFTAKTA